MTKRQNINLKLIEVPAASVEYEGRILGTNRLKTPVQTQPVLLPSLELGLREIGYDVDSEIINMKLMDNQKKFRKKMTLGKLELESYMVGASFESVEKSLREADIIGLTSNFTYSAGVVEDFIAYAKRTNPKLKILVGGTDASARQEFYLNSGADAVIEGEGEKNGPLAIDALMSGKGLEDIARVAFKKNGEVIKNINGRGNEPVIMDELPLPALDKVDVSQYTDTGEGPLPEGASFPSWAYETSRGCVQACKFCTTPYLKPSFRRMSLERISREFKHAKKAGVKTLFSWEDNPLSRMHGKNYQRDLDGREEVLAYLNLIKESGLAFEFSNGLELGKLADENGNPDTELINALFYHKTNSDGSFSGTFRFYAPLETLTDDGIKRLKKLRSYDVEKDILDAIAQTKIPMINFGLMVGAPEETPQSLDQTKKRYEEIRSSIKQISPNTRLNCNLFMFTPLPGTPYFRKYRDRMIAEVNIDPEFWNFSTSCINGDHYSADEMTLQQMKLFKEINGTTEAKTYT